MAFIALCYVSIITGMASGMVQVSTVSALYGGIDLIPDGDVTPHPQCFSGHDDLKTDEDWPIVAYRAFYTVDKAAFARWDKGGREMPHWMGEAA